MQCGLGIFNAEQARGLFVITAKLRSQTESEAVEQATWRMQTRVAFVLGRKAK
jgi:hypothetical protein